LTSAVRKRSGRPSLSIAEVHGHGGERPAVIIEGHAGAAGHFGESPAAFVVKQEVRFGVDHEEVEQATAIVVEPTGRDRPRFAVNACLFGDVLEFAAQIAIEPVPPRCVGLV
jgi:hypothetical protein